MSKATETFCPATMCPLIAPKGSPWTGSFNTPCLGAVMGQRGRNGFLIIQEAMVAVFTVWRKAYLG